MESQQFSSQRGEDQEISEENDDGDDEEAMSKKRAREEKESEDKKNRGNYRCSKCNLPKKGHVCPFQPRFRRKDQPIEGATAAAHDASVQVELDADMTVRTLPLEVQGLPESYMVTPSNMTEEQFQQYLTMNNQSELMGQGQGHGKVLASDPLPDQSMMMHVDGKDGLCNSQGGNFYTTSLVSNDASVPGQSQP